MMLPDPIEVPAGVSTWMRTAARVQRSMAAWRISWARAGAATSGRDAARARSARVRETDFIGTAYAETTQVQPRGLAEIPPETARAPMQRVATPICETRAKSAIETARAGSSPSPSASAKTR